MSAISATPIVVCGFLHTHTAAPRAGTEIGPEPATSTPVADPATGRARERRLEPAIRHQSAPVSRGHVVKPAPGPIPAPGDAIDLDTPLCRCNNSHQVSPPTSTGHPGQAPRAGRVVSRPRDQRGKTRQLLQAD